MLSERIQNAFAKRVEEYFDSGDKGLRSSTLWLLDAGISETEIMSILRDAWDAGWNQGYGEGYDEGRDS